MTKHFHLDRNFLFEEIKTKSVATIARENNCSFAVVRYRLKKYGLPTRNYIFDPNKGGLQKGSVYGLLTVVSFYDRQKTIRRYLCTCACGNFTIMRMDLIKSPNVLSCGCHIKRYNELRTAFKGLQNLTRLEKKVIDQGKITPEIKSKIDRTNNKLKMRESIKNAKYPDIGNLHKKHWKNILSSADRRGIIVEVNQEYCWELYKKQQGLCALSGIPITLGEKNTGSLDRINSLKNYTPDNIQWVHKSINKMKSNLKQEQFVDFCRKVTEHLRHDS